MAPKGFGAAAKAVAKGRGRGGGGRGAGRKPSAVNSAGADSASSAPKRTQQSLSALLGERFAKKQRTVDNLNAGGFFQQYGRERTGAHRTVIPPFARPAVTCEPRPRLTRRGGSRRVRR